MSFIAVRSTALLLLACLSFFIFLEDVLATKPHILLVVIDDLGWTDHTVYVGKHGTDILTPNMEKLAKSGILLDNYYVQQVCSPTRTALMTGRFPFRVGMQHSTTILPGSLAHVPLETPMLPEMLKTEGYETHMIGKWHLGYAKEEYTPTGRGFDSHYGYYQGMVDYYTKDIGFHNSYWRGYDFWFNGKPLRDAVGNYSLDQYMDRMYSVVDEYTMKYQSGEQQGENPLFLYMPHQTVHIPIQYRNQEKGCSKIKNSPRRDYCSMIVELDRALAQTVDKFKQSRLWDNTLMLVTTDNGGMVNFMHNESGYPTLAASAGSNYPLRGSKSTLFEGGVRGTAFINGGKNIIDSKVRGSTYSGLMHAVDYAAMILGQANVKEEVTLSRNHKRQKIDGIDLFQSINKPFDVSMSSSQLPHRENIPVNINYGGSKYTAVRFDNWKLIVGTPWLTGKSIDGWFPVGGGTPELANSSSQSYYLFNMDNDRNERNNLAGDDQYQSVIATGKDIIRGYIEEDYTKPQPNRFHLKSLPKFHKGFWAPFLRSDENFADQLGIFLDDEANLFQKISA